MSSKNLRLPAPAPGAGIARMTPPDSTMPAKMPKPEPRKCSVTSLMMSGFRRSGFSDLYFSIDSLYSMRGKGYNRKSDVTGKTVEDSVHTGSPRILKNKHQHTTHTQ